MTDDVRAVRALLAPYDPNPEAVNAAHDVLDRAGLARILATPRLDVQGRKHAEGSLLMRRSRWAMALTAAAVAGLAVALVVSPLSGTGRTAYAATPPLLHYQSLAAASSAASVLHQLADRSDAQPASQPARQAGGYHYLDLQAWSLWTQVHRGQARSRVVPTQTRSWIADDGSGQTERVSNGHTDRRTYAPGEWARMYDVASLSTNPATLARQLAVGHPTSNGVAELFVAVTDLWREQAPAPVLQAAILRALADQPGLVNQGTVIDRAGRPGVAISVDSDYSGLPTRYTLIFDDSTGMLRDYEEMLTTTAGKLNVPVPSVISYTVWRGYGEVTNAGDLPGRM